MKNTYKYFPALRRLIEKLESDDIFNDTVDTRWVYYDCFEDENGISYPIYISNGEFRWDTE